MTDLLVEASNFLAYLVGRLILGVIMETMVMLYLPIKVVLNMVPLLVVSFVLPSLTIFFSKWGVAGDIVGCGIDFTTYKAFFTRNGTLIGEYTSLPPQHGTNAYL